MVVVHLIKSGRQHAHNDSHGPQLFLRVSTTAAPLSKSHILSPHKRNELSRCDLPRCWLPVCAHARFVGDQDPLVWTEYDVPLRIQTYVVGILHYLDHLSFVGSNLGLPSNANSRSFGVSRGLLSRYFLLPVFCLEICFLRPQNIHPFVEWPATASPAADREEYVVSLTITLIFPVC